MATLADLEEKKQDLEARLADGDASVEPALEQLDRAIAAQGHYPAVDVLTSKSRVMVDVTSPGHQANVTRLIQTLSIYKEAEDLINIGAYVKGSNPKIDYSIKKIDEINTFLRQNITESFLLLEAEAQLEQIFKDFPS